jgi:undecaprenyl-diphosphatase
MLRPKPTAAELLLKADAKTAAKMKPIAQTVPVRLLGRASEVGDQPQARAIAAALIVIGILRRDLRMTRAGARVLIAHEAATFAKNFIKRRVDRTRPRSASGAQGSQVKEGRSFHKEETSFPSGHSAGASAAAVAFAGEYPEHRLLALAGAAAVAAAQVPRCAHYPTDVGAGLAIGVLAGAASNWAFAKVLHQGGCDTKNAA